MKRRIFLLSFLLILTLGLSSVSAKTPDANGIMTIGEEDIKQAYDQYMNSMCPIVERPFNIDEEGTVNENGNLTDVGRERCLAAINFYRALCGSDPVTLSPEYTSLAQSGVDYLAKNHLSIDHNAADNSDDEAAKKGLGSSNLSGGKALDSIHSYFTDTGNISGRNTGHRDWLIRANQTEMGIAQAGGQSALYVFGETKNMEMPVVSYPAAGISPLELNGGPSMLWSIDFGSYYKKPTDLNQLNVTVTDDAGNTYNFINSDGSDDNALWFKNGFIGNSINLNVKPIFNTLNNSIEDHTFTITVSGFTGDRKSLSYQSTIKHMNEILGRFQTVYRMYNRVTGEHLYSTDQNEVQTLCHSPNTDWNDEGIGWVAPMWGDYTFRLYSPVTGKHLYSSDGNEVISLSFNGGWSVDNNEYAVFMSGGHVPIYRLYNPESQMHLLTTDENEYNTLKDAGWNQEGVKLYAFSIQ